VVFLLCILWAGTVEYGRWLIAKEQAQTAVDAASLAAATSGVQRWVRIDIVTDRGEEEFCSMDACWCEDCGTVRMNVVGNERELIDEGGWRA